ncbi:hypothetical protein RchiOBHm_Chr7g0225591 [Rosa chinensis]|uniref:Uncharacterized protein n=1 Tax=Rosa chinensis TaxID=74649 RepID=A0A2P6PE47_ROSCH|nr:hypothetical protein RchiOBHm_Chr7g0225591 [Rosa chinensis]
MSQFYYLFLCSNPIHLQMSSSTFTSLILTQLPLSFSIPSSSFSTIMTSHLCSTWVYIPNSTPENSCRTDTLPLLVDVAGPMALCCSMVSTTTTADLMSFGTFILLLQTVRVWRMIVDKPLAFGSEALANVTPSATWRAAAMAAGLLEVVLCDSRSRVFFFWGFWASVCYFLLDVG